MNKAPVLSVYEVKDWLKGKDLPVSQLDYKPYHREAQRDADHKHYQGIIREIFEEIEKMELPKHRKSWVSDGEKFEDALYPSTPEDTRLTILSLKSKYQEEK